MKFFTIILLVSSLSSQAQGDFFMVKKKDRTIKTYYAGTQIAFLANNGAYRDALITAIKDDSIYLQEFYIQRIPTTYGGFIIDTAGSFRYIYHYNQIRSFRPPSQRGFNISGSGSALFGGGVLLTLASGVSYIADKEKFSPELLGAAMALGTIGYFMSKSGSKGIVIGRKYSIEYMKMK